MGAAAAGVALVALLAVYQTSRPGPDDGLDYWLPLDSERLLLRSAPGPEETARFLDAIEAYGRHDVARVIDRLGSQPIPQTYEPLKLVLASALIWDRRYEQAGSVLSALDIDTLPQPARDRARWMLYTVLRRTGREGDASAVARGLASAPGEFSERARAQLP